MKKFEFRLDQVLRLKKQRERLADLRQQKARFALDATLAAIRELEALLAHHGHAVRDGLPWLTRRQHAAHIEEQLDRALERKKAAEVEFAEASAARAKIATEVEALVLLREEKLEVHEQQAARDVQRTLDEQGLRRWLENAD